MKKAFYQIASGTMNVSAWTILYEENKHIFTDNHFRYMMSKSRRFVGYKQRRCTDVFCLVTFIIFICIFIFISILAISLGNPISLIQPSDSFGNICGQNRFKSRPYQLYFDIRKCLIDNSLSLICPTTKVCVNSCPTYYSHYQSLHTLEGDGNAPRNSTRQQLICMYDFNPTLDNRTVVEIINDGLCAPYTLASEPFLDRCLPSVLTNLFNYLDNTTSQTNTSVRQINTHMFGINSITDVGRVIALDLDRIKESLALFILLGCLLVLLYMFALKQFTGLIVSLTIVVFLFILFISSSLCWYTIYTGQDFIYEQSTIARIVNDFIRLRTIYYILACITTFLFVLSLLIVLTSLTRIRLSVILLKEGADGVFSVLSTLVWSPLIIVLFLLLTTLIIYIEMCLLTVGKPIFRSMVNHQSVPCLPNSNSNQCIFQQEYGYDSLVFNNTDRITQRIIKFLVDYKTDLKWFNLFAYLWFGAFLFAFEEIVLAGVFSNYYWSKDRLTTLFPLIYSIIIVVRYHVGSIAFGSLLIATLKYIRIILEYIHRKVSRIQRNTFITLIFTCFFWLFEKCLKFLNRNSYVLIATHGYPFCKATRKAFVYLTNNCLRLVVLVNLTEWILFSGIITICTCNTYFFYQYLQWTNEFDQLMFHWIPIIIILIITYLIASIFFNVYNMAIKTLFLCFLEDLDENDGSIQYPYAMNNALLRLVHKTNSIIEKE